MPMLSPKRQITIPKEFCDRLHIQPGDTIDFVEHEGRITLIKKQMGASDGVLKHLNVDSQVSDEESLIDAVTTKRQSKEKGKRNAA